MRTPQPLMRAVAADMEAELAPTIRSCWTASRSSIIAIGISSRRSKRRAAHSTVGNLRVIAPTHRLARKSINSRSTMG